MTICSFSSFWKWCHYFFKCCFGLILSLLSLQDSRSMLDLFTIQYLYPFTSLKNIFLFFISLCFNLSIVFCFFLTLSTSSGSLSLSSAVYQLFSTDPLSSWFGCCIFQFWNFYLVIFQSDISCKHNFYSVLNSQFVLLFPRKSKHSFVFVFSMFHYIEMKYQIWWISWR